jgi:hypothetical protein
MKLSDGRKVTMQIAPDCEKRDRLRTQYSQSLSDWQSARDQVSMTLNSDPAYAEKVEELKASQKKLRATQEALNRHCSDHRCS